MQKKSILIFGTAGLASLTSYSLSHDAGSTVLAHVVDDEFVTNDHFEEVPLIGLSQVQALYPPETCEIVIPLGHTRMNALRQERCEQFKAMGYQLYNFVSSHATVWPDCKIQENTLIYENSIIQPHVSLGSNVIIRAGANIGHHSTIGDHSFVASGVITGGNVTIGQRCFIGLGAILRDGVHIAERTFIGAGAVIVKNTEPDGVYVGNPARRLEKTSMEVTSGV